MCRPLGSNTVGKNQSRVRFQSRKKMNAFLEIKKMDNVFALVGLMVVGIVIFLVVMAIFAKVTEKMDNE